MKPVKRIELVVSAGDLARVVEILASTGITSYTAVRGISGRGERGERSDDELSDAFRNVLLVVACEPDRVQSLVEGLRPLLRRYGGMCLVSDAQWLIH